MIMAYYGCLMIKKGDADGMVSGACHSTANILRPACRLSRLKPGTKLVSAFFLMEVRTASLVIMEPLYLPTAAQNQNRIRKNWQQLQYPLLRALSCLVGMSQGCDAFPFLQRQHKPRRCGQGGRVYQIS